MRTITKALILSGMVFLLLCILEYIMSQNIVRNSTIGTAQPVSAMRGVEDEESILRAETRSERYERLGGRFLTKWVEPHIEVIDRVLIERGYAEDPQLIQTMFYVGEHESHWRMEARGGFDYEGTHYTPIGAFQMLDGTFRAWNPTGSVYSLEDQLHAFVTMYENDRVHCGQFHVMCPNSCGWEPCL